VKSGPYKGGYAFVVVYSKNDHPEKCLSKKGLTKSNASYAILNIVKCGRKSIAYSVEGY
jgi:hypothetical protein